ncbi:MAG: acyl-CoA mutase large subunit family protein, partial [Candidatus Cloacimonetes bacterium]|nr:acyl-CoA mutase large subunit family protein [Candidatus Cloacimonadota bacterium]
GITLDPIYWQEDIANLPNSSELPGYDNYTRGTKVLGNYQQGWNVAQEINVATPKEFNTELLHDLNRGQTAVNLPIDEATRIGLDADQAHDEQVGKGGVSISTLADLETALDGVELKHINIDIHAYNSALVMTALLAALAKKKDVNYQDLSGSIGMDPLSELAGDGTICLSLNQAYNEMYELTKWTSKNAPKLKSISIHSYPYHNAGASNVEELAFAFATAVEYIRQMLNRGLHINVIAKSIQFNFSLGSNFFMEISKIRAARMLWSKIIREFGGDDEAAKIYIHAKTSSYNKTKYDPYVNMLRTTTEAFSGVIGGVDSLQVDPFDKELRQPDRFSRRIARNQQIILNEECHLSHVIDPAGGSWYIESLTSILADKVWEKFRELEAEGGIYACLENEKAQTMLAEIANARMKNLSVRRDTIVGTNMYANMSEKDFEKRELDLHEIYIARKAEVTMQKKDVEVALNETNIFGSILSALSKGASLGQATDSLRQEDHEWPTIKPLNIHRLSESFENLRDQVEAFKEENGRPKCYLANMGNVSQYKGRSDFSRGFFEVGGFGVSEGKGCSDPIVAANMAIEADAPVVVLCSSDKNYPEYVPEFAKKLKAEKPDTVLVLAGYPKDQIEEHKQNGVDTFIHVRANAYQILSETLRKVGVIK